MISADVGELTRQILAGFKPPPQLRLSEYANEFAVMTGNAAEKGRWSTLPYQREILDAFTDPSVETVATMKSARVGWTKMLGVVVQYYSHQDPCPVMIVQPVKEDAEGYSKEEIKPLFEDTPVLRGLISESKARNTASNTILLKQLANGGLIDIVNAASGRSFRRKSRKVVLFDEVDAYPRLDEGDPIKLGRNRADYYWDRKIGLGGTPIFKGGKTEEYFLRGDQRRYFVPCPFCQAMQVLRWEQMIRDGEHAGHYECENCAKPIPHSKKRWMVERGKWRATAISQQPGLVSFHIWAAYSYSPAADWTVLVREHAEALDAMRRGDPDAMQTFHNTVLGEPWEDSISGKLTADGLAERRKDEAAGNGYAEGVIPDGVLMITAGVDVQGGAGTLYERLVVTVWGWGRGEEGWHLGHWEIDGDPQQVETLDQLDQIAATRWQRADGKEMKLTMGGIDDGGIATHEVRDWCRSRSGQWVPMKGEHAKGKPLLSRGTPVDVNRKNQGIVKRGVLLYQVGYEVSVNHLQGRLRNENPGPGYLHFGMAATDQFLAELFPWKRMPRRNKGHVSYSWTLPTGSRDEGGDCTRMAYAALQLASRRYNRATMWDQLAAGLGQYVEGHVAQAPAAPKAERSSSGWLDRDGAATRERKRGGWLDR
jgi:phage terminase large subunit GpA-like protein